MVSAKNRASVRVCILLGWGGAAPDYACSLSMRGRLPYSRTCLGATGNGDVLREMR